MEKSEIFNKAKWDLERGYTTEEKYVSDMSNWLCVHATNYMPQQNATGDYFIQTTAMATNNEIARATIHVTLNQIVYSHMSGNWDSAPFVILAPYNDVVEINGKPSMVASEDTYFIPNPDTGLVLPKNACIIKPDNSTLFTIGEHVSTYKTDNYTEQEIQTIFSFMPPYSFEREEYDKYNHDQISKQELTNIFFYDEKLKQRYEQATDKKPILHEICEQRKNAILKKNLRNAVVTMTMEKMGYLYIHSHEDSVSGQFAETAKSTNIPSNSGRQAHSASLEKALEANSKWLSDTLSVLKTGNLDDIYSSVTFEGGDMFGGSQPKLVNKYIRASIIKDNSPDFYDMYTETFNYWNRDRRKTYASIKDYNPRLDEVIRRNNERMTNQYSIVLKTLKQNPKFDEFKQKLEHFDKPWLGLSDEELMLLGIPKENQNY
ncbi:MAG: hypothetical protein J6R22_03265 [Alphaproteobacteria bacterium]|nr:hypothetical protein [Alphaproteobacteria bacterium]